MAKIPAVTKYTISETLLGGHVVNYQCPHCDAQLKSKESEIGQADQCPKCGKGYGVTRKALLAIQQTKTAKREEKRRLEEEREAAKPKCVVCGAKGSFLSPLAQLHDGHYCDTHLEEKDQAVRQHLATKQREEDAKFKSQVKRIVVTTTPTIEGHQIVRYLGVDGVEYVTGTGFPSETVSDFSDFFGARSKMFESKLRQGRLEAIQTFKHVAVQQGANAIIGVDFDYSEFGNNRTAIIVSGTLVQIEPRRNAVTANDVWDADEL